MTNYLGKVNLEDAQGRLVIEEFIFTQDGVTLGGWFDNQAQFNELKTLFENAPGNIEILRVIGKIRDVIDHTEDELNIQHLLTDSPKLIQGWYALRRLSYPPEPGLINHYPFRAELFWLAEKYNLIKNAGFEDGEDWGGDETLDSTEKHSGLYSARLEATGVDIAAGFSNRILAEKLTKRTIEVEAMVKITSYTAGRFVLRTYTHDVNEAYLGEWQWDSSTGTFDWTKKTGSLAPTHPQHPDNLANAHHIHLNFVWLDSPVGIGYVDDFVLTV